MSVQFSGSYMLSFTFQQKRGRKRCDAVNAAFEARQKEIEALPDSAALIYSAAFHPLFRTYPKNRDRIIIKAQKPTGELYIEAIQGGISKKMTTADLIDKALKRLQDVVRLYDITQ